MSYCERATSPRQRLMSEAARWVAADSARERCRTAWAKGLGGEYHEETPSHGYTSGMRRRRKPEALGLGPLETEIMRVLWKRGPSLASEVEQVINRRRTAALAYTTVANVLLNLEKKDVVDHTVEGRAFRFAPRFSEDGLHEHEAKKRSRDLLDLFAGDGVAAFVSEVRADPALKAQFRAILEEESVEGGGS